jgi:hypothetical protein
MIQNKGSFHMTSTKTKWNALVDGWENPETTRRNQAKNHFTETNKSLIFV